MRRRSWMGIVAALLAVVGGALTWDALVETDEERLEGFVEEVSGELTRSGYRAARGRWVDLERQPFEVSALGQSELYRAGEVEALDERSDDGLRTLYGDRLSVLSHTIEVDGDRARASTRVVGRRAGMMTAEWSFARHGEDWLLERASIHR